MIERYDIDCHLCLALKHSYFFGICVEDESFIVGKLRFDDNAFVSWANCYLFDALFLKIVKSLKAVTGVVS